MYKLCLILTLLGDKFLSFWKQTYLSFHLERSEFNQKCYISVIAFLWMRREVWSIPKVKSSSWASVAVSGTSLAFSVRYINSLRRNNKFLHRWTTIWKMLCKVLDKVIFMFCVAMCVMTWVCLNRWWNILLASDQTTLETFGFVSPRLRFISPEVIYQ